MKKYVVSMLVVSLIILTTGCGAETLDETLDDSSYVYPDSKEVVVTLDEFNQLSSGMTEQEVWDIVGGQCTNTGTTDLGIGEEYATVSYGCNGEGSIGANVILMFQGGKLSTMSQFGLE